jgi:methylated-DNA-[protein]-cysteine S-methyltransferase
MKRERSVIETPLGRLALITHDDKLAAVDWTDEDPGLAPTDDDDHLLTRAATQIAAYFAGDLHRFDLPLAPAGTPFRQKVWSAMLEVPYGRTTTYGDVAREIGGGPRAVGGACGANPLPIIIPCHRVLASSGLGGYSGRGGLDVKQFLLRHEARHKLR